MAGRAYHLANLLEISWRDLQWVEIQRRAGPSQREELPVQEEVVEDDAGVISSVIVPTLAPVTEDTIVMNWHFSRSFHFYFNALTLVVIVQSLAQPQTYIP